MDQTLKRATRFGAHIGLAILHRALLIERARSARLRGQLANAYKEAAGAYMMGAHEGAEDVLELSDDLLRPGTARALRQAWEDQ